MNGYYYHFRRESKIKHQVYWCSQKISRKCYGSITLTWNREIVKKIEHTCDPLKNKIPLFRTECEEAERELKNKGILIPEVQNEWTLFRFDS
jgi:hypothetical protein